MRSIALFSVARGSLQEKNLEGPQIIDYILTAPESLCRVANVKVECATQQDGANALGSDHHLLFVDWKLSVDASNPDCPRRSIFNYLKLQKPAIREAYNTALTSELQNWSLEVDPFCLCLNEGTLSQTV
jgi:hypothetical protein